MDKKTLSIILGVAIIGAFFLPYFSFAGIFKLSAFDLVSGKEMMEGSRNSGGSAERFVLLVGPLAGVLLLIGALNNGNYILGRPVLGILGLIGSLYLVVRILIEGEGNGIEYIFKLMGLGFWLGLIASIVVLVYNPPEKVSNK